LFPHFKGREPERQRGVFLDATHRSLNGHVDVVLRK